MIWRRLCALVVGGVFLSAAFFKLQDPPGFAHQIHNYQLLPEALRNPFALVLPWLEAWSGLWLLLGGLFGRPVAGAARWAAVLLVVFLVALLVNLLRGHAVDCGCFGGGPAKDAAALLRDMKWAVARDLGLLALCAPLLRSRP